MTSYKFKINGKPYEVSVNSVKDGIADVNVNGVNYNVEIENAPAETPVAAAMKTPEQNAHTLASASDTVITPAAGGKKVTSPLPGVVIELCVTEGEAVKRGQKLLVLEAMKMENEILAESDGTILKIFVNKGDTVLEGADLALLA